MLSIHIYMVLKSATNEVVYVGASMRKHRDIDTRHKLRFGRDHHVEILEIRKSVSQAAIREEYWFWQMRSWGFQLENRLPFKKYRGPKPEYKPLPPDWYTRPIIEYRLSQASIEAIRSFPDLYDQTKGVLINRRRNFEKMLDKNDWNSMLTAYQIKIYIKRRVGLSDDQIYETRERPK
jgi:hypothetical protein